MQVMLPVNEIAKMGSDAKYSAADRDWEIRGVHVCGKQDYGIWLKDYCAVRYVRR